MKYLIFLMLLFVNLCHADWEASFEWIVPDSRENGTKLELVEIGGYEIDGYDAKGNRLYRIEIKKGYFTLNPPKPVKSYKHVIKDSVYLAVKSHTICVYDVNGLYSRQNSINPKMKKKIATPMMIRID